MNDGYELKTGSKAMDASAVHAFLCGAYWSEGIPFETVKKAIRYSVCIGVFHNGHQVGFARATTDRATFAYIAVVYVLEGHRGLGLGLGKHLLSALFSHSDLKGLRRMMLATRDAGPLYEQFGFSQLANPDIMMENRKPGLYTGT